MSPEETTLSTWRCHQGHKSWQVDSKSAGQRFYHQSSISQSSSVEFVSHGWLCTEFHIIYASVMSKVYCIHTRSMCIVCPWGTVCMFPISVFYNITHLSWAPFDWSNFFQDSLNTLWHYKIDSCSEFVIKINFTWIWSLKSLPSITPQHFKKNIKEKLTQYEIGLFTDQCVPLLPATTRLLSIIQVTKMVYNPLKQ